MSWIQFWITFQISSTRQKGYGYESGYHDGVLNKYNPNSTKVRIKGKRLGREGGILLYFGMRKTM